MKHRLFAALVAGTTAVGAMAQSPALADAPSATPPQLVLGQRIQAMRDKVTYLPIVVIVTDAASYIDAIGAWTTKLRFPVLIDDGSAASREDIARFVRGFAPSKVVRWHRKEEGAAAAPGAASFDASSVVKIRTAVQRIWGVKKAEPDATALAEEWKKSGHNPPGIVVATANDHAWTAALPLAAAWGQPIVFLEKPPEGLIDWSLSISDADTLESQIEAAATATGLKWDALGDTLDSITLCLNSPERIKKDNEFLALSDRIGRVGQGVDMKKRWAWTGHIFGTAAQASYRSMCSLFLHPKRAWIFDGYPDTGDWAKYDGTRARDTLEKAGLKVDLDDTPKQSARDWRQRCSHAVTADLILVNSKGNNDFFDLEPGQCKPGDLPILARPAALHFIHSWSLLFPGKRESVGGRWFERGVFAYAGSVHEPFLGAFAQTPVVAGRFSSGSPFACCVRLEGGPVWKIAVLGDPLYTPGPGVTRSEEPLPLEGAQAIGDDLRELLQGEKWDQGVQALKLLGRDADITKIAATLLDTKPDALNPSVARDSILAAFRTGESALVIRLFAKASAEVAREGPILDAVWLVAGPLIDRPDPSIYENAALLRIVKDALRDDQMEGDARIVSSAWKRQFGPGAADGLFSDWKSKFNSKEQRAALDKITAK